MSDGSTQHADNELQGTRRRSPALIALKAFTSQWFLIPQGTGIIGVILHNLGYQFDGLKDISRVFWVLTILLLVGFLVIYTVRAFVFPQYVARQLSSNIMETACMASISITFTTIIQMISLNLVADWGQSWGTVAYVLWWINAVMAFVACIGIPYVFTKVEGPGLDSIPAAIMLPLIAALTAAAGGGVVCRYAQLDAHLQVPVIIVSYLFIGLGLPLSVACDAIILARMFDNAFPMKSKVYSLMILCGPLGQGSFALQILGQCVRRGAFAAYDTSPFLSGSGGETIANSSQFIGLITWGYGLFWWGFACIAITHYSIATPKDVFHWDKHLDAWSMVFPWGVYTNGALELGTVLDSSAFRVVSTILTVILVILWLLESAATLTGVFKGNVLGLDRGWLATYYADEGDRKRQEEKETANEGASSGQPTSTALNANDSRNTIGLTSNAWMRHRETG